MAVHIVAERPGLTRGVLFVHSSPRALCPHLEWAVSDVLGSRVSLDWLPQPVLPGQVRGEISWQSKSGTAARITSALRQFKTVRYEVAEEPSRSGEGERFAVTPSLGVFRATMGPHGDIMIHEDRLRAVVMSAGEDLAGVRDGIHAIIPNAAVRKDVDLDSIRLPYETAGIAEKREMTVFLLHALFIVLVAILIHTTTALEVRDQLNAMRARIVDGEKGPLAVAVEQDE